MTTDKRELDDLTSQLRESYRLPHGCEYELLEMHLCERLFDLGRGDLDQQIWDETEDDRRGYKRHNSHVQA